jgi:hypothetical protein
MVGAVVGVDVAHAAKTMLAAIIIVEIWNQRVCFIYPPKLLYFVIVLSDFFILVSGITLYFVKINLLSIQST